MIIKTLIDNEDKKELEYMLSFDYAMPYGSNSKSLRRKIIYILTPVLFLIAIGCYLIKSYFMFYVGIIVSLGSLIWILYYLIVGKKFEKKVHEFIWEKSKYETVEIVNQCIKMDGKLIFSLKDVTDALVFKNFFFFIIEHKRLFIVKTSDSEKNELMEILQNFKINIESKDKYFNVYKYFKRNEFQK